MPSVAENPIAFNDFGLLQLFPIVTHQFLSFYSTLHQLHRDSTAPHQSTSQYTTLHRVALPYIILRVNHGFSRFQANYWPEKHIDIYFHRSSSTLSPHIASTVHNAWCLDVNCIALWWNHGALQYITIRLKIS